MTGTVYRVEMYVPPVKRQYGYYVPPVLVGDHLVGGIEPLFDRKSRRLEVLRAWGDTSWMDEALQNLAEFVEASTSAGRLARNRSLAPPATLRARSTLSGACCSSVGEAQSACGSVLELS